MKLIDPVVLVNSSASLFNLYRIGTGFVVPCAIVGIGTVSRRAARGKGWKQEDFYAGAELILAGVSGALLNIGELLLKPGKPPFGDFEKRLTAGNMGIVLVGLFFYYFNLTLHQDFGPESGKSRAVQLVMLVGMSNVIGLACLFGAIILMTP